MNFITNFDVNQKVMSEFQKRTKIGAASELNLSSLFIDAKVIRDFIVAVSIFTVLFIVYLLIEEFAKYRRIESIDKVTLRSQYTVRN